MARRKKDKKKGSPRRDRSPQTGKEAFNPALNVLANLKESRENGVEAEKKPGALPVSPEMEDISLFREAMSDVRPLKGGERRMVRPPDREARPIHPPNAGDLEVMAYLSDLVSGTADLDIAFSDEFIEGCVKGFDRKLMQKLRQGLFPIQDHVDLHGYTRQDAELKVMEFLLKSYRLGLRCVLVVHGKGLNSEDHIPVLKERLPVWLNRGPVRRIVLAFSTARPYDGGTGAIYVLLRRLRGRF